MVESKDARDVVRALTASGALPSLPPGVSADDVVEAARAQGLSALLLAAIERGGAPWAEPVRAGLAASRRGTLVRTLGQIGLAARVVRLLDGHGIRSLPLKGVVLAETVYDVESDRPMSDVDLLALERWGEGVEVLRDSGFTEVDRGDHAWAFRDVASGELVELHRSVTSCPGLFPLDPGAVWQRSRTGGGQLARLPSVEDLLVQLALHAAFQHGLVLSLVQWLDFRRVLEREEVVPERLLAAAGESRARAPLAAALFAAEAVVAAPLPRALREVLRDDVPAGLARWLAPRLDAPLAFVAPEVPDHVRARWELVSGSRRRVELLRRTLFRSEDHATTGASGSRLLHAASRAWHFAQVALRRSLPASVRSSRERAATAGAPGAQGEAPSPPPSDTGGKSGPGQPSSRGATRGTEVPEVSHREELLLECLRSFPWVRLTVTGHCMQPALDDGQKVHLVEARRRPPRMGDVILARCPDGLRLHRLVWGPPMPWASGSWRTKADRGVLFDPALDPRDVLATVVEVEGEASARRPATALASLLRGLLYRLRAGAPDTRAEMRP